MDEEPEGEEAATTHKRMSDLGLLRSFRPSSEEELGELPRARTPALTLAPSLALNLTLSPNS